MSHENGNSPLDLSPENELSLQPELEPSEMPVLEVLNEGKTKSVARPNDAIVDTSKISAWKETQDLIQRLESNLQARVLFLYTSPTSSITAEEVAEVYNHLHFIGKQEKIAVIVHGSGGSPIAAYRIVKLLRRFCKRLMIVAPGDTFSALTTLALGGDEIHVGPLSVFSPTDTSIVNHQLAPTDSKGNPVTVEIFQLKKYLQLVEAEKYSGVSDFRMTPHYALTEKIHPIFLGSIQRALSLSKMLMSDILKTHIREAELVEKVVERLNDDYPSHAYPIMPDDLRAWGVPIRELDDEVNEMSLDLVNLACSFTKEFAETQNEQRKRIRRPCMIETRELRSFYSVDRYEKFVNNAWVQTNLVNEYRRAAVAKTKRGYYEARVFTPPQFRDLRNGKVVEVE